MSTNARRSKPSQPTRPSRATGGDPTVTGGRGRAAGHRHGRRARPARGARSGCSARSSARSSQSRQGRSLFAHVERIRRRDDRPPSRRRSARAGAARRRASGLDLGPPRRSSTPSRCTSGSSISPRRAVASGRCDVASALRATAFSTTRSPMRSRCLRRLGRSDGRARCARGAGCRIAPVLTAHPTEARRRTTLVALRRCAGLLERLDDPRLTPSEDREIRRRLREEITLLWRTSDLRIVAPDAARRGPDRDGLLRRDAVHGGAAAVPGAGRRAWTSRRARSRGLPPTAAERGRGPRGSRPSCGPGRWIGGDRDGNPEVTAEITERTLRIHADHVLRGYEAVGDAADADHRRGHVRATTSRGPSRHGSPATPRTCPRRIDSSAAGSPTSRTASGSGSSPSGCAGRGPRSSASRRR